MTEPYVLLDNSLDPNGRSFLFESPVETVICHGAEDLAPALARLEQAQTEGLTAAGYIGYELGYLLEPKLAPLFRHHPSAPILWMGLFERGRELDSRGVKDWIAARTSGAFTVESLGLSCSKADYLAAYGRVKDYIAAGDVYQINLTFKQRLRVTGDRLALYRDLTRKQRVRYGAIVETGQATLLSLSPELFLSVEKGQAQARPMKGTAKRGRTTEEDQAFAEWLATDPKSRAENLMIVDLLRNDLGRAALIGTVTVTDLYSVEPYPTLHQMTSGITARLHPGVTITNLLQSLFPCGSITGAPKVRAMEVIHELEPAARGPYTGSIGMIRPDGDLAFNVAIRTLLLDRDGNGELGIGSGLVHDSEGEAEFDECLLKAEFLNRPYEPFQLIETLRWQGGYDLLDRHLARLARSARRFHFACDLDALRSALDQEARGFSAPAYRVRLLLDEAGAITITSVAISVAPSGEPWRYAIAETPLDSANPFLYHKTTKRAFYDETREAKKAETGCDEVIFQNERGELTEGSITTLFIEKDGELLTPPISSGLLPGTLREDLLADPARRVREAVLYPADLEDAEAVYLGNSVRGLLPAVAQDKRFETPCKAAAEP